MTSNFKRVFSFFGTNASKYLWAEIEYETDKMQNFTKMDMIEKYYKR